MDNGTISLVLVVITILVFAYLLWQRKLPLSLEGFLSTAQEAVPIAQTLTEVATIGVQAAEQLAETGRLAKDARLDYAVNYVKSWNPALKNLSNEKIYAAIESAVLVVNSLQAQATQFASDHSVEKLRREGP